MKTVCHVFGLLADAPEDADLIGLTVNVSSDEKRNHAVLAD